MVSMRATSSSGVFGSCAARQIPVTRKQQLIRSHEWYSFNGALLGDEREALSLLYPSTQGHRTRSGLRIPYWFLSFPPGEPFSRAAVSCPGRAAPPAERSRREKE